MSIEYQPAPSVSESIWEVIGLPSRGARLHELIRQGLPSGLLDQVARLLEMPRADISRAICISSRMSAHRAKAGRLTTAESDRLMALIALFEEALSLFENDLTATRIWMDSPVRGLGLNKPLDMLGTRVEANAVPDLIGRLERGVLV